MGDEDPRGPRRSIPPPRPSGAGFVAVVDPENALRGAKNVVTRCLCPTRGEKVFLLSFHAGPIFKLIETAAREADAIPIRIDLENFAQDRPVDDLIAALKPLLAGATAAIFIAPQRPPQTLSLSVAKTLEGMGARLLYLLQVDERLLGQSVRADPELLRTVNDRLIAALAPPATIQVTSEAGTALEIQLSPHHPLLASAGRPGPGGSENLPAGSVYTHPLRVHGTLVVDRAIFGPKGDVDRLTLRRSPVRAVFQNGRLHHFDAEDRAVTELVDRYLESHAQAGRVGLLVLPTNYLVRAEIGIDRQDMLLAGASISLGFANAANTKASYEAPVQLVLLGRKQTVEVGGRKLVDTGRFDQALVAGIDPFR